MSGGPHTPSARYGEKLLRDINGGSLFELLHDAKHVLESEGNLPLQPLHIKQLDDLICSARSPVQTRCRPVVELTSASSAAGKTSLLYFIAAKAVLPRTFKQIDPRASHAAVVFIDTNGQFDANRLRDVALGIVIQEAKNQGRDLLTAPSGLHQLQELVVESLKHVHVFRPSSSAELLTILHHLPAYLLQTNDESASTMPKHYSRSRPVHSLLIDSASAFYYQDARANEVTRLVLDDNRVRGDAADSDVDGSQPKIAIPAIANASDLVSSLRHVQRTFECAVIFTTWGLYPRVSRNATSQLNSNGNGVNNWAGRTVNITSFKSYLPAAWSTYPTCRLMLQREPVKQFPPDFSLEPLVSSLARPDDGEEPNANSIRQLARERQSAVHASGFIATLDATSIGGSTKNRNMSSLSMMTSSSSAELTLTIKFHVTKLGVHLH
ncbi:hypothetical protein KEM56_000021 [Ascosphaera pollenicola]|nr:hypothetical protein KEM56_000021 [Ascosphaera pollenicola]